MKTKQTRTLLLLSTVAFVALNNKAYGSEAVVMPGGEPSVTASAPTVVQAAPGWVGKVTNFGAGSFVGGLGEDFLTQFRPKSSAAPSSAPSNPTVVSLSKLQVLDHYLQLGLNDQLAAAIVAVLEENTEVKDTKQREVEAFVAALLKAFQDKSVVLETPSSDVSQAADIAAEKASLQVRSGAWHGFLNQSLADLSEYTDKIAERKAAEQASLAEVEESKVRTLAIAAEELVAFMAEKAKAIDAINATAESDTQAQEVLKKGIHSVAASRTQEQLMAQETTLGTKGIEKAKNAYKDAVTEYLAELEAQMALEIAARDAEIAAIKERKIAALTAEDDKEATFRSDAARAASELDVKVAADIAGIQSATQADLVSLRVAFEAKHGPYVAPVLTKGWMEWQATFEARQSSVSLKLFNELLAEIIPPTVSIMAASGGASATAGETATDSVVVPNPLDAVLPAEDAGYDPDDESVVTSEPGLHISKPTSAPISAEGTGQFMAAVEAGRIGAPLPSPAPVTPIASDAFSATVASADPSGMGKKYSFLDPEGLKGIIPGNAITLNAGSINTDGLIEPLLLGDSFNAAGAIELAGARGQAPITVSSVRDGMAFEATSGKITVHVENAFGKKSFGGGTELSARMFPVGASNGDVEGSVYAPAPSGATTVVVGSDALKGGDGLVAAVPVKRTGTSYSSVAPQPRPMMTTVHVGSGEAAPSQVTMATAAQAKPPVVPTGKKKAVRR